MNQDIAKLFQSTKMKNSDKLLNTFRTCWYENLSKISDQP